MLYIRTHTSLLWFWSDVSQSILKLIIFLCWCFSPLYLILHVVLTSTRQTTFKMSQFFPQIYLISIWDVWAFLTVLSSYGFLLINQRFHGFLYVGSGSSNWLKTYKNSNSSTQMKITSLKFRIILKVCELKSLCWIVSLELLILKQINLNVAHSYNPRFLVESAMISRVIWFRVKIKKVPQWICK